MGRGGWGVGGVVQDNCCHCYFKGLVHSAQKVPQLVGFLFRRNTFLRVPFFGLVSRTTRKQSTIWRARFSPHTHSPTNQPASQPASQPTNHVDRFLWQAPRLLDMSPCVFPKGPATNQDFPQPQSHWLSGGVCSGFF